MNLKQAIDKDKLEQFISERSSLQGNNKKFKKLINSICQSKKAIQETSAQDSAENYTDIQTL
jgi:hypothetical protein